jgi:hypothetical protein
MPMRRAFLALTVAAAFTTPAFAANYPVSGAWGESASTDKGPIDCSGKRVITFKGNQRTDSKGGVPSYRNYSVTQEGPANYRIVDEFDTAQIRAMATLTLKQVDADHLEVTFLPGGTVKLQKCK